jgi:predicted lipoprotein with Yx(FWY)xxD motif
MLRAALSGDVFVPGDDGYDQARRAWNLAKDQRPAVVVFPGSAAEVARAVQWARWQGMRIAPQATGHGAGRGTVLKSTTIGGTRVLANARGFTLYWFAPDSPAASKCYGSCAACWPPVTGTAAANPGVPGRIGTITRTGGSRQLTYNGHPLYTYIGDSASGQARGKNLNLNLNGGLWHEVTVSQ